MNITLTLVELGVSATAAIASSAVLGWWWRGRSQSTKRAVLDELWTRKLRSMEVALEESENHRTREGTGMRLLQADLDSARDALASAKQAYHDASDEIAELKESLERRRLDIQALDRAGAEMAERRKQALAELEKERERSAKLAAKVKRLAPLPARLAEREEELARLDRKHAAELDSRDAEVRRMTDWIAELSSLPDALKSREADVRELRERLRAEVAKGEERAAEAHGQLVVLDAEKLALAQQESELKSALAKREAELELLRAEHDVLTRRTGELGARVDQLESAAAAVDARIERERQGFEDVAATQRDQASSERERLARRLVEREEELRNAQRALAAARADSEGASVELRSLRRRVEELNRADARRRDGAAPIESRNQPAVEAREVRAAAAEALAPTPTPTPTADAAPAPKRRRKPIDELELAVAGTLTAPTLFAELQTAPAVTPEPAEAEAAPSVDGAPEIETPAELAPYVEAVAEAVAAAQQSELEEEEDAEADTAGDPDAAPADTATEAVDEAAEVDSVEASGEVVALDEDEPEVILQPHRAAPPSMPSFPGTDDGNEAPRAKRKRAKADVEPAAKPARDSEARPEAMSEPSSNSALAADDFTRIRGIGPRTADKLVAAGIKSFADFAELSGDALSEIAEAIGVGASKIKSSGWQKSARRLSKSKR